MADRTSAEIFSSVFRLLAERPATRSLAREVWDLSKRYDFHPVQMDCDAALETLGLARRVRTGGDADFDEYETHYDSPDEAST